MGRGVGRGVVRGEGRGVVRGEGRGVVRGVVRGEVRGEERGACGLVLAAIEAGLAALDLCDAAAYRSLVARAERLAAGIGEALAGAGLVATVSTAGPLVGLHLGPVAPRNYDEARTTDEDAYAALFHALLRRGVALAPGAYEVMFPGLAHDEEAIDRIVEAMGEAATEVVAGEAHRP